MALGINPITEGIVIICLSIFLLSFLLKILNIPSVITYIIAGVVLGSSGLGLIANQDFINSLGDIGVILLLFFIGMEVSISKIVANWKVALIGTSMQVMLSTGVIWVIGMFLGWELARILLLGFVITLSSTAVVLKVLESKGELNTPSGQNVISVLLVQDVLIIPMLVILSLVGGDPPSTMELTKQIGGALAIIVFLAWLIRRGGMHLPIPTHLREDEEMQVFTGLVLCFGLAGLSALLGLSPALGAFLAGIVVASSQETSWVHDRLHPLYVVFVALFFLSIGLLIDLSFIREHLFLILGLVLISFVINFLINFSILKALGEDLQESIYAGLILAQIGEFSFVMAAVGFTTGTITQFGYDVTISVISLSLLLSPFLIMLGSRLVSDRVSS